MTDYNIEELVSQIDFSKNSFQDIHGMMLTNYEIDVLKKYQIPYLNCNSLKEIIYEIEEVLMDGDLDSDDLESISKSISERDYYQNTNK